MNHGIVASEGHEIGSRVWALAMADGAFAALYASGSMAGRAPWDAAHVRAVGGPAGGGGGVARYEPEYDDPFFRMCASVYNLRSAVAVPGSVGDDEAVAVLREFETLQGAIRRRWLLGEKVRDVIRYASLPFRWAYLLRFF